MKGLICCWLCLTMCGAWVMSVFDKPKPEEEVEIPVTLLDTPKTFIPVSCEAKTPCFVQPLRMVSPNGGREFTGCVVNGNEMLLTPCKLSAEQAAEQRSIQ